MGPIYPRRNEVVTRSPPEASAEAELAENEVGVMGSCHTNPYSQHGQHLKKTELITSVEMQEPRVFDLRWKKDLMVVVEL